MCHSTAPGWCFQLVTFDLGMEKEEKAYFVLHWSMVGFGIRSSEILYLERHCP